MSSNKSKSKTDPTPGPSPVYQTGKAEAKKAKAAPKKAGAKKAKAATPKGRPSQLADNSVIKVLVPKNPKRPTSAAGKRFDLYKPGITGMTVAEFLKAGGWRADLRWDLKQGFIEVGKPA